MQKYLFPKFGQQASHAKMSRLLEWAKGQGLKGQDLDYFMNLLDWLRKDSPELFFSKTFTASLIHTKEEISKSLFEHWPNSGILSDGVFLTARISESHNREEESILLDVIETAEVQEKYYLSPSAAKGILRRANRMKRPLFPPLRESLVILAERAR